MSTIDSTLNESGYFSDNGIDKFSKKRSHDGSDSRECKLFLSSTKRESHASTVERANAIKQRKIIDIYLLNLKIAMKPNFCKICHKILFKFKSSTHKVNHQLEILIESYIRHYPFSRQLPELVNYVNQYLSNGSVVALCHTCKENISKHQMPQSSIFNGLYTDSCCPQSILNLTYFELQAIKIVSPFCKIVSGRPHLHQTHWRGDLMLFPQNILEINNVLPYAVHTTFLIEKRFYKKSEIDKKYLVNIASINLALEWLQLNNNNYKSKHIKVETNIEDTSLSANYTICEIERFCNLGNRFGVRELQILLSNVLCDRFEILSLQRNKNFIAYFTALILNQDKPIYDWSSDDLDNYLLLTNDLYNRNVVVNDDDTHVQVLTLNISKSSYTFSLKRNQSLFLSKNEFAQFFNVQSAIQETLFYFALNNNSYIIYSKLSHVFFLSLDSHLKGGQRSHKNSKNGRIALFKVGIDEANAFIQNRFKPVKKSKCICILYELLESCKNFDDDIAPQQLALKMNTSLFLGENLQQTSVEEVFEKANNAKLLIVNREKQFPLSIYDALKVEALAFPELFPFGEGNYTSILNNENLNQNPLRKKNNRSQKPLELKAYFKSRINNYSSPHSFNKDYIFYALVTYEKQLAMSSTSVMSKLENDAGTNLLRKKLYASLQSLRGYASYWRKAYTDLFAIVNLLGPPTFFLTFTVNELGWDDLIAWLYHRKTGIELHENELESFSIEKRFELVNDDPVGTTLFCNSKFDFFFENFLKKHSIEIFGGIITDYFIRVEFQMRGSPHYHFVIWVENWPEYDSQEALKRLDNVISTSSNHKYAKYQRHICRDSCLRKNGKCRYGFPRPISANTCLVQDAKRKCDKFLYRVCEMGDQYINNYNAIILEVWMANMDIQCVAGLQDVIAYITKYITKNESSQTAKKIANLLKQAFDDSSGHKDVIEKIQRLLMNNREVSSQEAIFRILGLPLKKATREVCFIDTDFPDLRAKRKYALSSSGELLPNQGKPIIQKYIERPIRFENYSLFELVSSVKITYDENDLINENVVRLSNYDERKKKAAIKIRSFKNMSEDYYYYTFLLLFVPFRDENYHFAKRERLFEWFNFCKTNRLHSCNNEKLFNEISRAIDDRDFEFTFIYDNHPAFQHDEVDKSLASVTEQDIENGFSEAITIDKISDDQRLILCDFKNSIINHIKGHDAIRYFITGEGGTGKSFILKKMTAMLDIIFHDRTSYVVGAPTGVAARNVKGTTLHSIFMLPVNELGSAIPNIDPSRLETLKGYFKSLLYVFIDEISMLTSKNFNIINERCKLFMGNHDVDFGGLNLIVFGDFYQLPPVLGSFVFDDNNTIVLWRQFQLRELTTNHRQKDNVLLEICNSLRLGHLSNDQALALAERQIKKLKLSDSQLTNIDSLLHIYPLCAQVKAHNDKKIAQLRHSGIELICLNAKDTYVAKNIPITKDHRSKLKNYQISKTGGIPSVLTIGMHVRVMLVRNINVSQGLVNGAMGTIVSIHYPIVMEQNEFPETIKIKFDDIEELVAIHPVDTDFELVRGVAVRRKMFPLIHCFAATTHKVQGMTLNSAVVDLGDSNRSGATLYVALSRIININGLFIEDFSLKKLLDYSPNQKVIVEMERMRGNCSLNPPIKINRKRKKVEKPKRIENVVNVQSEPNLDSHLHYNVSNALIGTFEVVNFRNNFNVDDIDYATLVPNRFVCAPWLNDRIVDASVYGLILQIYRPENIRFITCQYFATIIHGNDGSHFLSRLFAENVNPDLIVLPICISNHWILVIFRKMEVNYQCFYYDPITPYGNFSNYIHNAHQILMRNIQWIQCDYRIIEGSTQINTNDCEKRSKSSPVVWLTETQNFFLRSEHAPLDSDYTENIGASISVIGRCKKCTVFGESGYKYCYYTIRPFNCGKRLNLYFPVACEDESCIKANDINTISNFLICGKLTENGIDVELITKVPSIISKAKWDKNSFDSYTFRWRMRIAIEMFNFHKKEFSSEFNKQVCKRIIYQNSMLNPHLDGKEMIFKDKWLNWASLLLNKKAIGVSDYQSHCAKIAKLKFLPIHEEFTQYFHYNGLLIDPKLDKVIPN